MFFNASSDNRQLSLVNFSDLMQYALNNSKPSARRSFKVTTKQSRNSDSSSNPVDFVTANTDTQHKYAKDTIEGYGREFNIRKLPQFIIKNRSPYSRPPEDLYKFEKIYKHVLFATPSAEKKSKESTVNFDSKGLQNLNSLILSTQQDFCILSSERPERGYVSAKLGKLIVEYTPGGKGSFALSLKLIDFDNKKINFLFDFTNYRYPPVEFEDLIPFSLGSFYGSRTAVTKNDSELAKKIKNVANKLRDEFLFKLALGEDVSFPGLRECQIELISLFKEYDTLIINTPLSKYNEHEKFVINSGKEISERIIKEFALKSQILIEDIVNILINLGYNKDNPLTDEIIEYVVKQGTGKPDDFSPTLVFPLTFKDLTLDEFKNIANIINNISKESLNIVNQEVRIIADKIFTQYYVSDITIEDIIQILVESGYGQNKPLERFILESLPYAKVELGDQQFELKEFLSEEILRNLPTIIDIVNSKRQFANGNFKSYARYFKPSANDDTKSNENSSNENNVSEDHYKTLGINKDSTILDINKAYRKLALKYHPDKKTQNPEANAEQFRKINEAYSVLSDPEERKKYDESLKTSQYNTATSPTKP